MQLIRMQVRNVVRQVSPEELCGPRTTGKMRTMTDDGFQMAGVQQDCRMDEDSL
jgi:hypothetical protein